MMASIQSLKMPPKTDPSYHAYTTKFDVVVDASQIDSVLGSLSSSNAKAVEEAWEVVQTGLLAWRTQLHLAAAQADMRIRQYLSSDLLSATTVTLLFDQSGSMRGQKTLFAAATADIVQEFVMTLGMGCEVLGFTTVRWKGGRSRKRWKWRFRPRNPGRLNDLLHIIYKSADDKRTSSGGWDYRQMLRHDLTKENIDGEAVEWAANRLSSQPVARRLLIVISDGAPVDDSTIIENGPTYLSDHLESVVSNIVSRGEIRVAFLGIGYRAHKCYPLSGYVEAPSELGHAVIALLENMLMEV